MAEKKTTAVKAPAAAKKTTTATKTVTKAAAAEKKPTAAKKTVARKTAAPAAPVKKTVAPLKTVSKRTTVRRKAAPAAGESERGTAPKTRRRTKVGMVVSAKMSKTVNVEVEPVIEEMLVL